MHLRRFSIIFFEKTNVIVIGLTASILLLSRSIGVLYFASGACICSLTVKVTKRVVQQPRPVLFQKVAKKTYGMPSTHSASISFFATYIALACIALPSHEFFPSHTAFRILVVAVTIPWAVSVIRSRVFLGYHTPLQVLVGTGYGVGVAVVWFMLWTKCGISERGRAITTALKPYLQ